jgi:long-chain acyl-CoA synthetase
LGPADEKDMASGIPIAVACISFPGTAASQGASWDDLVAANPPLTGSPTRPALERATIIYTSGTTGIPKGVMHSFASLSFNARCLAELLEMNTDQRMLSYLPLAHIVERVGIETLALFLGCRIFFVEGVHTFVADVHRARPTLFLSVPRLLLKFQQNVFAKLGKGRLDMLFRIPFVNRLVKRLILRQLGLDTVRHAASGAAPLPAAILQWYRQLGLNLVEGYGMTETLITHLPAPGSFRAGYLGCAIRGVEARLGENNELLLRSPMNMLGYYRDPQGTRAAFLPNGFFRTGDMAEIAPDGQLKIVGRLKEQFKTSKGKYVAPAPIESKLAAHPAVEACCLMGAGLASPFAIILLSEEARKQCADPPARAALEESLQAQMEEVNAQLDPHERVAFLAIVDGPWTIGNGLLTPTLKLKRPLLEGRYQGLVDEWKAGHRPIVWESPPQAEYGGLHAKMESRRT